MQLPVIQCSGCGVCCRFVDRIPDGTQRGIYGAGCPALHAQGWGCTIYADRPKVCRDTEVGGPTCLHLREKARHADAQLR